MHMADALISPQVGGAMWAASAGLIAYCSSVVRRTLDDRLAPMMGVLGAFVFAAMMINFSIPATGSSGHFGGGLILAILLGPHAAFVVMASVLTVQALFFADGGLLALGCNMFNLGFIPAFVAYPLVYRFIARDARGGARPWAGAMVAGIVGLQLGAFAVVMETVLSGITALPFGTFLLLMQPIHLAIGVVEGLATAAVVSFVLRFRPVAIVRPGGGGGAGRLRGAAAAILLAAALLGGVVSWFASTRPDGLEWATGKALGSAEIAPPGGGAHEALARVQEQTSFLPDYGFKAAAAAKSVAVAKSGLSLSGLVGGLMTLALAAAIGYGLRRRGT